VNLATLATQEHLVSLDFLVTQEHLEILDHRVDLVYPQERTSYLVTILYTSILDSLFVDLVSSLLSQYSF
jgi:hypothetical protein